jgi:hypothetical protein
MSRPVLGDLRPIPVHGRGIELDRAFRPRRAAWMTISGRAHPAPLIVARPEEFRAAVASIHARLSVQLPDLMRHSCG